MTDQFEALRKIVTNFYWRNKVAVVTGASSGIGASIAVHLADAGMVVIGIARRSELVEELKNKVSGPGKIYARRCDLTDERSLLETFNWIRVKFHIIHVLVNNAGMLRSGLLTDTSRTEVETLFNLNVVTASMCIREAIKCMRSKNYRSHIIVVNSILGHRIPDVPVPMFSVYPASKFAISGLCQTVRQEINFLKLNIKLTSINPGLVDTDLLKVYSKEIKYLPKLKPEDVAQAVFYALDTPDYVQIEDITLQAMHVTTPIKDKIDDTDDEDDG